VPRHSVDFPRRSRGGTFGEIAVISPMPRHCSRRFDLCMRPANGAIRLLTKGAVMRPRTVSTARTDPL